MVFKLILSQLDQICVHLFSLFYNFKVYVLKYNWRTEFVGREEEWDGAEIASERGCGATVWGTALSGIQRDEPLQLPGVLSLQGQYKTTWCTLWLIKQLELFRILLSLSVFYSFMEPKSDISHEYF